MRILLVNHRAGELEYGVSEINEVSLKSKFQPEVEFTFQNKNRNKKN